MSKMSGSSLLATETRYTLDFAPIGGQSIEAFYGFTSFDSIGGRLSGNSAAACFLIDATVSNFYIAYSQFAGITQQVVTTIPITVADTYLKIAITPSSISYYINNVLVAQIAVAVAPTTGLFVVWSYLAYSSITAGRTLSIDAVGLYQQFNTPRTFSNTVLTQ